MEVQIASLCDSAADYNGKLCIIGTFDTILSHNFPFSHPQCSIAMRLLFRVDDEGLLALKVNIVNEDGASVAPPIPANLEIVIPEDAGFFTRNVVFNLQHLKFDQPGAYSVDVEANGRPLTSIPFRIVRFNPPRDGSPEKS